MDTHRCSNCHSDTLSCKKLPQRVKTPATLPAVGMELRQYGVAASGIVTLFIASPYPLCFDVTGEEEFAIKRVLNDFGPKSSFMQ